MRIDHIGYAVRRMDRALDAFKKLGFAFEPVIDDKDRNVSISFGEKDSYRIELIAPLDKSMKSPVDQYLTGAMGIPYHICYESSDLDGDTERLKQNGFKLILEPKPAVAFGGRRVVFLMSLGFGLMEIVEMPRRQGGKDA